MYIPVSTGLSNFILASALTAASNNTNNKNLRILPVSKTDAKIKEKLMISAKL